MKKGSATAAVLVLALLAQTAAAVGRVPCTMGFPEPAPASQSALHEVIHSGAAHAGHAIDHHGVPAKGADGAQPERAAPEQHGSCCDGMTTQDCVTGGCTPGAGTVLAPPVTGMTVTQGTTSAYRALTWLPPYLNLTAAIFRPPIV